MKILWLVNIMMPELADHLGREATVFGGWLIGAIIGDGWSSKVRDKYIAINFCYKTESLWLFTNMNFVVKGKFRSR